MDSAFVWSLIAATFVGGAAGYLGSLMITRRMALVGDALGHVALPGMGLALLLHVDPALGAFVFLALGVLFVGQLSEKTELSMETVVGIAFVSSLALGFLIVPQPELLESLIGDVSKVSLPGAVAAALVSAGVLVLVRRIYSGMMLLNLSPDLAAVEGISVRKYNFLYLMAVALIVSVGVKITGSLLVGALVIIPPATGRILSHDLRRYSLLSLAIGALGSFAGVVLSRAIRFPAGPAIILVCTAAFVAAFAFRRRA